MTETGRPGGSGSRGRILIGVLVGILAAGAGLGVAELVAVFTGSATSSLVVVGSSVIDLTPTPIKDFAIRTFGPADKLVLVAGVLTVLAIVASIAGILALRKFWIGAGVVFGFGLIGVAAATTRPRAGFTDLLPSLAAGIAAVAALYLLVRAAQRPPAAADEPAGSAGSRVDRRSLLITGAATAGVALVGGLGGRFLQAKVGDISASRAAVRLPAPAGPAPALPAGYRMDVPGLSPFFTFNREFYRVDTVLTLPKVPAESWTLRIGGDVERPLELSFDDLLSRPLVERDLTLSCVSNEVGGPYVGTARWLGFPLADLLREAGVRPGSDQLLSRSHDGMTIGTPMEVAIDDRDALLAVAMNGEPLPVVHGFPARMIIPGLYGYTSATKWVVELEATRFDKVDAYWTARDWDPRGVVKTQSRIDVPSPLARVTAGGVVVAGVAWAQHRGISTVQVRMDGGPWQDAELTEPVSADTWRQWRTTFDTTAGTRRFEVRAADGNGDMQSEERVPPFPAGSSGWHSVAVTVT
ncbi:MAG: molybdopterin-dependent oxidoreductase [Haloechinothrix sp.]